jgi:hypothetical protein
MFEKVYFDYLIIFLAIEINFSLIKILPYLNFFSTFNLIEFACKNL